MTATLRVVLDQAAAPVVADLRRASLALARNLVATSPRGCDVEAIAPAEGRDLAELVPGIARVHRLPYKRAQLAAACQLGVVPGFGGGMIHSPTMLAPLVRHDRVHDNDQTVVTIWNLDAWTAPERLSRGTVAWRRAMLKRAVRHADAIVVPTHVMAQELAGRAKLEGRIRVISGATDAAEVGRAAVDGRTRIVVDAVRSTEDELATAFGALARSVDARVTALAADRERVGEAASAAGLPEHRLRMVDAQDAALALEDAAAFVDMSATLSFPWRMLEALHAGVPVVAAASAQNAEVLADAGQLVAGDAPDALADTIDRLLTDGELGTRMRVLSSDRSRAFSWRDTAERVWQLHADL
ncbi:glycosyltransferase [Microbacterium sp. LRZ72]|uniref:glycosyltransferase n=1 Tax=Microbacterium sp. LRZ72 TaxID=2942481 RepID=UPI0029A39A74|nr:glycosyltransferase [Microbacterium sp. LRZ72]MDX2377011.1 glycosyltransferase [Microbacterium sp. LRZ72]